MMSMLFRSDSGNGPSLLLAPEALFALSEHRQKRCYHREAGGQVFGYRDRKLFVIEEITAPRKADLRSRFRFKPDRKAEQIEIDERLEAGLHYFGDWHSHPEEQPEASARDLMTIGEIAARSFYDGEGFFLLIVGAAPFPQGLWVSFHFRNGTWGRLSHRPDDG